MRKILVTGASGQLGQEFQKLAMDIKSVEFIFLSRDNGDICKAETIVAIRKLRPDVVINCAAYTAVDLAESYPEEAFSVNANGVKNLACLTQELAIPMIHFSTDYVYHNNLRRALHESDPQRPRGVYARSKLKGEKLLLTYHDYPLIFRVSWLYSTFGKNFPKTIIRLANTRDQLNVVQDQIGAPTNARDLASAVWQIIDQSLTIEDWKKISGIYNYSNGGTTNWYEIARFIVTELGINCQITPIASWKFPTAAPRPRYSKLNLSKFRETFDQEIRHWRDSMSHCLRSLNTKPQ